MMARIVSTIYAALLYGFIFLPVAVLVLFSFQGTLFPIPPFNGPSFPHRDRKKRGPGLRRGDGIRGMAS